jgi:uncharacterized protein
VKLHAHTTPESFLASASALLATDEPRHNLAYGICDTIVRAPEAYPTFYLWTVEEGGRTVVAAVMTPPFNIVVTRPQTGMALDFLATELHAQGHELPGATGALPEIDAFTASWEERTGAVRQRRRAHGIYAARAIQVPENVPGRMRPATPADRDLLISWWGAFVEEALPDSPERDHETLIDRRLNGRGGGLSLWEDGEPTAMAGFGGRTPSGVRIGPVYTPPDRRGRGYGSALTAELSASLLAGACTYCFLYTDLENPTSNRIYQRIGYEFVCESAEYAFEH